MKESKPSPVAIIGIDCIFAKSQDKKAFYHLLSRGASGITDPPATHQHLADYFDPDPKKPDHIYCNRGGYLPPVKFDPTEFSIPPSVIEATDTSQLLGLVTAKRAMDDAGYGETGKSYDPNNTSVILGVTGTQELVIPLGARLGHPIWRRALKMSGVPDHQADEVIQRIGEDYVPWQENSFPGLLGNVVAGRIANRFNLGGTNCVIDAACASSMGAIHVALMELRSGRSDMVITGGVDTINDAFMHMCFSKTQILSESGEISPFSKNADGTLLGEGIGLVVLKRLADAERDNDRIYAVIKGLGSSSDGKSQSIYAPVSDGQSKALRRAYSEAEVDPTTVSLVEAHGTGTRVGDVVEFSSLSEVFGQTTPNGNRCALGSVKSNIGHTKACAGTAGLIKTALSVYHKVLLPTCNAEDADPKLGVEHSPFYLNTKLRPWVSEKGKPRRAGVSAFGFGGSNFHAVLEEYTPDKSEPSWDGATEIVAFSGAAEYDLIQQINGWAASAAQDSSVQNIGKLSKISRKKFSAGDPIRLVMVVEMQEDPAYYKDVCRNAVGRLSNEKASGPPIFIGRGRTNGQLAFLFPGQGSQYTGMGKDFICCFPESLGAFQDAAGHLDADHCLDEYVYPRMNSNTKDHEERLRQTQIAQPAIGAVSMAMYNALASFGVEPDATCGHSYGELVALCAAGWMEPKDLWHLSVQRGRLMAQAGKAAGESGTMLAVKAPVDEIAEMVKRLDGQVVLANRNSLEQGVLSGTTAGIDAAAAACKEKGWRTVKLPVAAAFHSPIVAEAQKPFEQCVQSVSFTPTPTQVMSNTLGTPYGTTAKDIQATLGRQLACPVDFVSNVRGLYEKGVRTFVEVGPKTILTQLVHATLQDPAVTAIAMDQSMGRDTGIRDLAATLSQLAALGFDVELDNWEKPQSPRRKAKMVIDVSGANYRPKSNRKTTAAAGKRPSPAKSEQAQAVQKTVPGTPPEPKAPAPSSAIQQTSALNPITPVVKMEKREKKAIDQALNTVQQGLASIQALQTQTAQAHQKFLETQAEASKTLQQMIQSAQQLTGHPVTEAVQVTPPPAQPVASIPAPAAQTIPTGLPEPAQPSAVAQETPSQPVPVAVPEQHEAAQQHQQIQQIQHAVKPADDPGQRSDIQKNLIHIVSELTGYPAEMLGPDMDIESDLGIDSIKRVEILSALEEKMPQLPKVTPDLMGTLKTLGQIVDYLGASTDDAPSATAQDKQPAATADNGKIQQTLTDIVSELTGYPAEMLGPDMDIESDLGIDSIKRVEILSALEEKMPQLPKVTPDLMGTLKTLGQIVDFLSDSADTAPPSPTQKPAPGPGDAETVDTTEIQQTLTGIVSELTGYPTEMLGPDMDIESDLGIDSIKRVEILSALEEKMPQLPKVTPDLMGTLKTLGQIVEYLSAGSAASDPMAASASAPTAPPLQPSGNPQEIQQTLTDIVSNLTGYPTEMLGPDMDIESDLGIDSIKRVEILSALEEKMPDLPKVTPDLMGTLKTLGQIVEYLAGPAEKPETAEPVDTPQPRIHVVKSPSEVTVERRLMEIQTLEIPRSPSAAFSGDPQIGIAGAPGAMGPELITALKDKGIEARLLNHRNDISTDLPLAGLILFAPMAAEEAFEWAQAAAPALTLTAKKTKASFVSVTTLDGAFGFSGRSIDDPHQGALAGLVKTAGIEWEGVHCMAVDIDPAWTDAAAAAQALCDALCNSDNDTPTEIGLGPNGSLTLDMKTVSANENRDIDLHPQDVVIVTGGARGVTAAASQALAAQAPCTLVLVGRSPAPQPEPAWLAPLVNEGEIKKAILNQHTDKANISPRDIEAVYRKWISNRDVLKTLQGLEKIGATAHYRSVDVRDEAAVASLVQQIRTEIGPVRALIHGAGVIEDRLIIDKRLDQFRKVYNTKVQGLQSFLAATAQDDLKYMVLFSSVSARMGNQGQVDYAMANEVLNKIARQESDRRPECKVVSINWGPWDGGMVTPGLKRNLIKNNVALIPVDAGARAMVTEMRQPVGGSVEVIMGAALPSGNRRPAPSQAVSDLTVTCKRDVSLERYPVLSSHQLDGRPVVPLALITEWLAHSALHASPGLQLHGMDNLRLLHGIILDRQERMIRFMAGKPSRNGQQFEVDVEIRDDMNNGNGRVHSSARAILADTLPKPPKFVENGHFHPSDPVGSLDEIYRDVLFHGRDLRGITEIIRLTQEGISARLATAPPPARWINDPLRSRWIADPLVLDSAFQMAIVWCHRQYELVSLPSYAAKYRQYCHRFPEEGISAVMEVQNSSDRKMVGDFTFLDRDKKVLARLTGYEAIMDPGLSKAFKAA